MSRRQYIKYAGAGFTAAVVAGLGYYATRPTLTETAVTRPTSTETATAQSNLSPPTANFEYRPRYINPTSADTIYFLNESRNSGSDTDLAYSWYVDDSAVAHSKDYSTQLPSDAIGTPHKVKLSACRGEQCSHVERIVQVDPDQLYPRSALRTKIKGMGYDVGITWKPPNSWRSHRDLTDEQMKREVLDLINSELGCNGIRIVGDENERIVRAARIAMQGSFEVILLSPVYIDQEIQATIGKVCGLADSAETLKGQSDSEVILVVGNESTLQTKGMYNAATYFERMNEVTEHWGDERYQIKLNNFLKEMLSEVRNHFRGRLSYAKGSWEDIDWDRLGFDIVGLNEYLKPKWESRSQYEENIRQMSRFKKPIFLTEFGCATYKGALQVGGAGNFPEYLANAVYDQEEQVRAIDEYVRAFRGIGEVDGCFLWTFLERNTNDTAAFGIMRYVEGGDPERKRGFYRYKSCERSA